MRLVQEQLGSLEMTDPWEAKSEGREFQRGEREPKPRRTAFNQIKCHVSE